MYQGDSHLFEIVTQPLVLALFRKEIGISLKFAHIPWPVRGVAIIWTSGRANETLIVRISTASLSQTADQSVEGRLVYQQTGHLISALSPRSEKQR
jgi:hypothetical protein